jgi:hypothetical protein
MAAPNIVNIASMYGRITYLAPANTTANTLLSNAASSGLLYRVNTLTATNVTASSAVTTVSINSAASGGGTAYRIAFQITVPAYSSLVLIDKNGYQNLSENTSIVVTSGTSSAIEYVCSYDEIA